MTRGAHATPRFVAVAALALLIPPAPAASQDVHPTKQVFAEIDGQPAIAPGAVPLANFQPFRAVYERAYRTGGGEDRHDRVIITAERVVEGTTAAIMVTLIDTGNLEFDDTASRIHTRVFAEADNRMLYQHEPVPGTPRDYFIVNTGGPSVRITMVSDATGEAEVRSVPAELPQLGAPAVWLLGSMALDDGQGVRFAPADLPASSSTLGARPFLVSGTETIDAGPLGAVEARVVDYALGMANGRVMGNYLIDRPPYLVAKRSRDLESGEASPGWSLRLLEFTVFEDR